MRQTPRFSMRLPIVLKALAPPHLEIHGYVLNLSRGGLFITLVDLPEIGKAFEFLIQSTLPFETRLHGVCEVRWQRKIGSMEVPSGVGATFKDLSDESLSELHRILELF